MSNAAATDELARLQESVRYYNDVFLGNMTSNSIDVRSIALNFPGVTFIDGATPKMKIPMDTPNINMTICANGRWSCMGMKNTLEGIKACHKCVDLLIRAGVYCCIKTATLPNKVAGVNIFRINVPELPVRWPKLFPPMGSFPGLYFNLARATGLARAYTGQVCFFDTQLLFVGLTKTQDIADILAYVYHTFLVHVRATHPAHGAAAAELRVRRAKPASPAVVLPSINAGAAAMFASTIYTNTNATTGTGLGTASATGADEEMEGLHIGGAAADDDGQQHYAMLEEMHAHTDMAANMLELEIEVDG